MPGLPFSGKQKKAQLQAKRQRKAEKIARLESAEAGDKPEDSHGSNAEADAPADGHACVFHHCNYPALFMLYAVYYQIPST
ncbi:hypothetical protein DIPPA_14588 [Diplonema papillatum]|nr:hypothetical protein DIPPA_14596 [Diplonema papillatum]KAJ9455031.1 hypothetical protein DIPPA_14580 [Diplonema papillatum]KAJ9455032.1 hypothetical protein DIPPA_14588 [Diplonema papillatum]